MTSDSGWGTCSPAQAANAFATVGKSLGGGEAARMTPCDLLPYLRGRTLWILGCVRGAKMLRGVHMWGLCDCAGVCCRS